MFCIKNLIYLHSIDIYPLVFALSDFPCLFLQNIDHFNINHIFEPYIYKEPAGQVINKDQRSNFLLSAFFINAWRHSVSQRDVIFSMEWVSPPCPS